MIVAAVKGWERIDLEYGNLLNHYLWPSGFNDALPENPSGFGEHMHVEAPAHSLALPDAGHGNRFHLIVSLFHFV